MTHGHFNCTLLSTTLPDVVWYHEISEIWFYVARLRYGIFPYRKTLSGTA
jgi:hypothetical protein